ncbi:hypothetical protein Z042_18715 [Chania multitudinisentens RB-25]|uniref:Fimbrial-type adhesion domain-containing protein n=1 Tax=Chania multitudinisentens RB-25 TaxID=1441930 RepID=W0LKS2_9GAMM|nr:fimbrial protein [Chania multitudinisentens]AHG22907.1 hypothetical protein Z042_18715 [Chania multitudinisentens RB-25]
MIFAKYKTLILFLISVFSVGNAYALKCVNASDSSVRLEENIGSVAVPNTMDNGVTVWRSENRVMRVQCWKDFSGTQEYAYFYFDPAKASLHPGVRVGVNLGGIDIPDITASFRQQIPNVVIPTCTNTEAYCKANRSVFFDINYYVYIARNGTATGNYSGANTLDVFQIDGVGGLNIAVNSNFRYATTNMNGIRFLSCNANLSVYPSIVDFGRVYIPGLVVPGVVAKDVDFNIDVNKSCTDPMLLTATYSSTSSVYDNNTRALLDGVGLKIKNLNTNEYIGYNNVESFADLRVTNSVSVPFKAELVWLNNNPSTGQINSTLTITAYYN